MTREECMRKFGYVPEGFSEFKMVQIPAVLDRTVDVVVVVEDGDRRVAGVRYVDFRQVEKNNMVMDKHCEWVESKRLSPGRVKKEKVRKSDKREEKVI